MIDTLTLLYPLSAFIYLRIAVYALARWARNGKVIFLLLGIVAMSGMADAALRLFEFAAITPYWWITPLVAIALLYVFFKTLRTAWVSLARKATPLA
jgi:hypothetical protein